MNMKFAAVAALGALSLAAIAPQAAAADNGFYHRRRHHPNRFQDEHRRLRRLSETLDDNSLQGHCRLPAAQLACRRSELHRPGRCGIRRWQRGLDRHAVPSRRRRCSSRSGIIDIYARLGMANWDSDFNAPGWAAFRMTAGNPLTAWASARISAASASGRSGSSSRMMRSTTSSRLDISTISLSVTYTFL